MTIFWENIDVDRSGFLGGGQIRLTKLKDITVIFGKNGAGKSLLLRAWRDANPLVTHYVVPERTGEISFAPHVSQQELEVETRHQYHNRNFLSDYRQRVLARVHGYLMLRGNARGDGRVAGSPAQIEELIAQLLPEFSVSISNHPLNPLRMVHIERGPLNSIDQLSSGEAQLLWMGVDMLVAAASWEVNGAEKRVILLDEPDAHIHPDLLVRLAYFLVKLVEIYGVQLVISSHSTALLAAIAQFGSEKVGLIYLTKSQRDFAAVEVTHHVREISSCLGGHALMGALFGSPLLIVEGDDDYRLWSEVPRRHQVRIAVVPAHGSDEVIKFQRALERVMCAIRDNDGTPSGYALLDGDKVAPRPSRQYPQTFVPYLVLECREAENLYITDEVLGDLGLSWEQAVELLVEKSPAFGEKAGILAGAPEWDRKSADLKAVINEISSVLDPKNVHWTARVGAAIGRSRPSGQLKEYLGESLMQALWGVEAVGEVSEPLIQIVQI